MKENTSKDKEQHKWMSRPLTCEEYLKSYTPIIKYFIKLRVNRSRYQFVKDSADDIYQEVCILIFEHMNKHPERNITADVLRQYVNWRTNRMERKENKSPITVFKDMNVLSHIPIDTDLDEEEAIACMEDCLTYVQDKCSDLNQQIFHLRYTYGLPFKEIDAMLNITEGNSRKKYHRLLNKVKDEVGISNLNDDIP